VAEWTAALVEALGLGVIGLFALYSLGYAALRVLRRRADMSVIRETRQRLARGILLGLEFLVAADIVRTVAIDLTFHSVGVLAIVVAIRTFLSFSLELELTGRWPWQRPPGVE
jgi:uncharacterized membrane protein